MRRLLGRLGVGSGFREGISGSGIGNREPVVPADAGISCGKSGPDGLRPRRSPGTRSFGFGAEGKPQPVRYRCAKSARTMPGEIVRCADEDDPACLCDTPEHLAAGAAICAEPCFQALDPEIDQRPEGHEVPWEARQGREEGEGWHRGGIYTGWHGGWISAPLRPCGAPPPQAEEDDPHPASPLQGEESHLWALIFPDGAVCSSPCKGEVRWGSGCRNDCVWRRDVTPHPPTPSPQEGEGAF